MSFFLISLSINLKKISKIFIPFLIILPISILFSSLFLSKTPEPLTLEIGIYFDETNTVVKKTVETIKTPENNFLKINYFDNLEKMKTSVIDGSLECAYIFNENFEDKIDNIVKNEDDKAVVTLIKPNNTFITPIINESVFAAILKTISPYITTEVTKDVLSMEKNIFSKIDIAIENYYRQDIFVKPKESFLFSSENSNISNPIYSRILKGITALFSVIITAFIIPIFVKEKQTGIFKRLSFKKCIIYSTSISFAIFILQFMFSAVSIFIIYLIYPEALGPLTYEFFWLFLFILCLSNLGLLLITFLKKSDLIYGSIIFIILLHLIFGSIIIDISEISIFLANISKFFITTLYLNGLLSDSSYYSSMLVAITVIAGFLNWVILFSRNKKQR